MRTFITKIKERYDNTSAGTLFLAIFLIGLLFRVLFPDLKLLHHDEAIHAWFSYELLTTGSYRYDPMYHGPLLYYLIATAFSIFGDSDAVGRLVPAIFGALIIPGIYALYKLDYVSKNQAVIAALFFAISPNMVYFSRFLRHDIFQLFFTLLVLVCIFAYIERKKWYYALFAGVCGALALCLKEEVPAIMFIFVSFFIVAWFFGKIEFPETWTRDIVIAVFAALAIGFTFYSSFFAYPDGFFGAAQRALDHWLAMHDECRLCGPPYWYVLLFGLYELPVAVIGVASALIWLFRKEGLLRFVKAGTDYVNGVVDRSEFRLPSTPFDKHELFFILCLYWLIGTVALYGYIGEKVPWLLIHQLLPLIFVVAYALQDVTPKKKIITVLCGVYLLIMMVHVAFIPVADINEPIVQVQNSEQFRDVMALIDEADRVAIVSSSYWPLPWYYRGDRWDKIDFYGDIIPDDQIYAMEPDVIIAHDQNSYPGLEGYTHETYRLSYWFSWHENRDRILRWFLLRDGPMGSINIEVFTRE